MIKRHIGIILVLLATLAIYFPSLYYHFVGDDYIFLEKLVTGFSLGEVFDSIVGYFRPFIWLPYLLGFWLAKLPLPPDPLWLAGSFLPAYHFLNIVFHLANVVLVYAIGCFIFKSRLYSLLAAFIFAVHPLNSEVVCYAAVFGDLSLTFFTLMAVILYSKFYIQGNAFSLAGSLFCFILALLSKETALSIPFLIILAAFFLKKTAPSSAINKGRRRGWLIYFLIVVFYFFTRKLIFLNSGVPWGYFTSDIPAKIMKAAYYIRDLTFPFSLVSLKILLYRYGLVNFFILLSLITAFAAIYLIIRKLRKSPILIFSLLWAAFTLVIPLLAPCAPMLRHLYLPLAGYTFFLVYLVSLLKRKYIGFLLAFLYILAVISTTLGRNDLFRYSGSLVKEGLFELKQSLPEIEPNSRIFLVGIPGVVKNTYAFWANPEKKIGFLYKDKGLNVRCLSVAAFIEGHIKDAQVNFLDELTLVESMDTTLEEYIRVPGDSLSGRNGGGMKTSYGSFEILEVDKFGNIAKVKFWIDPQFIGNGRIYLVGYIGGRMGVLKSYELSNKETILKGNL